MRRRFALLALTLLSAPGCLIAYPAVSRCPGASVPASEETVAVVAYAKRVQHGTAPRPEETHTLRRAELSDGTVGPQYRPYLFRCWVLLDTHSEYVLTKLYRRGYKTVILDDRDEPAAVTWEVATTPEEQADAVRRLAYHARRGGYARAPEPTFPPGSSDPRHREVLLLIVGEFERVARLFPAGSDGAAKCQAEADKVRALAAE